MPMGPDPRLDRVKLNIRLFENSIDIFLYPETSNVQVQSGHARRGVVLKVFSSSAIKQNCSRASLMLDPKGNAGS